MSMRRFRALLMNLQSRQWGLLLATALTVAAASTHAEIRIWNLNPHASSGSYPGYEEQSAIDQNPSTFWTPGRTADPSSPAFIEIDLQKLAKVRRIRLAVAQDPTGWSEHQVYGRGADGTWLIQYGQQAGTTYDGQWLELTSSADVEVRYLLVQTTQSSGWVAWREIEVYEADPPAPPPPATLQSIPVLVYHSAMQDGCTETTNSMMALATDLELLKADGWTVIPALWAAQWVARDRDSSSLPPKVVAITFDDGPSMDIEDYIHPQCGRVPSALSVLQNFKQKHPDLPWPPEGAFFVIAAPMARQALSQNGLVLSDNWWNWAHNSSGLMKIYNHSADHDHSAITSLTYDPAIGTMGAYLAIGGMGDGVYAGTDNFHRIDTYNEADLEIRAAAAYIKSITYVWPNLFAYPRGRADPYLLNTYFPGLVNEHQTYAAFCTANRKAKTTDSRWCIPRLGWGDDWGNKPGSQRDDLIKLLARPD